MNTIINNLPWPIYVGISVGGAALVFVYVLANISKNLSSISSGLILIASSALFAGLIKLQALGFVHLHLPNWIPLPGLAGILLFYLGAYQITNRDSPKRKLLNIALGMLIFGLLLFGVAFLSRL